MLVRNIFTITSNVKLTHAKPNTPISYKKNIGIKIAIYSKMSAPTPGVSPCIFCNIVNKVERTEILYEDDDVCVFPDIKPASKLHILVIPKRHIEDVKCLTAEDKELVAKMLSVAHDLLAKGNQPLNDARLGYHWPPFRSVRHLHLHAIAPASDMGFISRLIFKKDSYWFVSPEYVDSMLA